MPIDRAMDRRRALGKLALGGAALSSASLVVSSPAFAYNVSPVAPTVTVSTNPQQKDATFTMAQPLPMCGGSATGAPSRVSTFAATRSTPGRTSSFTNPTGNVPITPAATTTLSFSSNAPKFEAGDTATILVTTQFTCPYPGGSGSDCRTYRFDFVFVTNFSAGPPTVTVC